MVPSNHLYRLSCEPFLCREGGCEVGAVAREQVFLRLAVVKIKSEIEKVKFIYEPLGKTRGQRLVEASIIGRRIYF